MSLVSQLSDLHIKSGSVSESLAYPGPRMLTSEEIMEANDILGHCQKISKKDFVLHCKNVFWRGRLDEFAVDGTWFRLRRMPPLAFTLDNLPSPLNNTIRSMLLSPSLRNGGLIYIVGSPGSGKTTTASATLVSRLKEFGGAAYTIEEPPEMPLNGWHGAGYCTQTQVGGDGSASDWAEAFRCVLRSQPVGENLILYVGEVRDSESAKAMLRAASNGFLVIATGFGSDLVSGLDSLLKLSGEDTINTLSGVLRIVIHQKIVNGIMIPACISSKDGATPVAARIRSGQLQHLQNDIQRQANMLLMNVNPLDGGNF